MRTVIRATLNMALATLVIVTAGCGYDVETLQRVLILQDRDLTAAGPLRAQRGDKVDARVAAIGLPLGTPSDRRLCGGMIGNTKLPDGSNRESIRSSAEKFTDSKFFLTFSGSPGGTLERQLFQASARHDFCYAHGMGTSGRSRTDCDQDLFADIDRLCRGSDEKAPPGRIGDIEDSEAAAACRSRAFWMKAAVDVFGGIFYKDNFLATCDYDSGAHPPRDQLVAGRFLPGRSDQQLLEIRAIRDLHKLELVLHMQDQGVWRRSSPVTLDLQAVELREGETGGMLRCRDQRRCPKTERPPTMLSDLFVAPRLLSYAPIVMKIDEGEVESAVLLGLHIDREQLDVKLAENDPRLYQMGWGPVFVPLQIVARLSGGTLSLAIEATAFRPAGSRTGPGNPKQDLRSNIDRFEHRLHVAKVLGGVTAGGQLCGAGQQIIAPYLGTAVYNRAQIEVRTFEFCTVAGRPQRMVSHTWTPSAADGQAAFWGSPDDDGHKELYRRFQHPPRMMVVGDGPAAQPMLHFFFRSKCDGPHGYCARQAQTDFFDLDDMLVQRLIPKREDHAEIRRSRWPPQSPPLPARTLSWTLYDKWGSTGGRPCFDKLSPAMRAATRTSLFGCIKGWDRLGHPMAVMAVAGASHTRLIGAFLTNCGANKGDPGDAIDARGDCTTPVGKGRHERLRLVLTDPASVRQPMVEFADLDSRLLGEDPEATAPRLAASYRAYPTLALTFGPAGNGLVFLRPGVESDLRNDEAWTVDGSSQFQPDAGNSAMRSLRLLVVAMRGERGGARWHAHEYVCDLPATLATRRWPLRAVPSLVIDGDKGPSTIVLAARTRGNDLDLTAITFNGAAPQAVVGSASSGGCKPNDAAGWRIDGPGKSPVATAR